MPNSCKGINENSGTLFTLIAKQLFNLIVSTLETRGSIIKNQD